MASEVRPFDPDRGHRRWATVRRALLRHVATCPNVTYMATAQKVRIPEIGFDDMRQLIQAAS